MTLKDDGKKRTSKASKGKNKTKRCKCPKCHENFEYNNSDVIKISGLQYVECPMCDCEIIIK